MSSVCISSKIYYLKIEKKEGFKGVVLPLTVTSRINLQIRYTAEKDSVMKEANASLGSRSFESIFILLERLLELCIVWSGQSL